jgi:hypothetical protein
MQKAIVRIIGLYRKSGGGRRWFGVDCNFEPSCSAYTQAAIERYGLAKGVRLGFSRIRQCSRKDSVCKCVDPLS